jgi:UDP-GlcNAc:undecaprenyl-phosphate/decaprenyl-phosphate GlcNAc-1-phosphate transferase
MLNLPLFYFTYFTIVFVLSILMNGLFLRFSRTLGVRKSEGTIRWSEVYKPALGGITFYIVFLLSLITYSLFFSSSQFLMHSEVLGLLAAGTISFLMGLADDAYDTNPILKFSTQVFCGIILIYSGICIQVFPNIYFNYIVTMLWIVGLMNAINLLDNMDAIASIVVLGALSTMISLILIEKSLTTVFFILMLGTASCILAFLFFNWHPSKMFMGDTGTQFLGLFMAALSILFLWNGSSSSIVLPPEKRILSAILTFALPIIDTTVVFFNRMLKGTSPFRGGKDHTTHHLYYLGLKEPQIAVLYIAYTGICLSCVVIMNKYLLEWSELYSLITTLFFLLSLTTFFIITRIKKSGSTTI